jgi:hypothetical protein
MSLISISTLRAGLAAFAMVLGLISVHSQAQQQEGRERVVVPFDFSYGSKQFKAGTYIIGALNEHTAIIRGYSNSGMQLMQETMESEPARQGKVVFHKYGDRYYLRDIFSAGRLDHMQIFESKEEKKMSRSAEDKHSAPQTVAVLDMPR